MVRFQAEQQRIWCNSTILFPTSKETCRVLPVAMSETDGCESPTNSPISCCVKPDRVSASISDLKSIDHIIGKPMHSVNRKTDVKVRDHASMENHDKPITFGERIKFARKAAKLSQDKLGQKVGTSQGMISELEGDNCWVVWEKT